MHFKTDDAILTYFFITFTKIMIDSLKWHFLQLFLCIVINAFIKLLK